MIDGRLPLSSGTPRAIKARIKEAAKKAAPDDEAEGGADSGEGNTDGGKKVPCAEKQPAAEKVAAAQEAGETNTAVAETDGGNEAVSASEQPSGEATEQFDDLLFPNAEELGASKAGIKDAEEAGQPEETEAAPKADAGTPAGALPDSGAAAAQPQTQAAPVQASKATWIRRTGLNMAAGTGRITGFFTVPQAIRTNSSTRGSF